MRGLWTRMVTLEMEGNRCPGENSRRLGDWFLGRRKVARITSSFLP